MLHPKPNCQWDTTITNDVHRCHKQNKMIPIYPVAYMYTLYSSYTSLKDVLSELNSCLMRTSLFKLQFMLVSASVSTCTVGLRIICTLIASIAQADRDRDQWSARILLTPWSRSARILLAKWSRAFLIVSIFASNHSTLSNSVGCRFQYSSFTLQFSIFLHRNHALVFFRGDLKCSKHLVKLSVAKQTCMFRKSLVHNIGFILRLFHSLKSTSFVTYIVMDAFDKTATAK